MNENYISILHLQATTISELTKTPVPRQNGASAFFEQKTVLSPTDQESNHELPHGFPNIHPLRPEGEYPRILRSLRSAARGRCPDRRLPDLLREWRTPRVSRYRQALVGAFPPVPRHLGRRNPLRVHDGAA